MPTGSRETGSMPERRSIPISTSFWCLMLWLVVGCNHHDSDRLLSNQGKNPLGGCLQCHVDMEAEHLASKHHSVSNMGCIECHGPSEGHLADENNEVKPDQIFAREDVDRLCGTCHKCTRKDRTKTPAEEPAVCTDCHAAHRFAMMSGG